MPAHLSGPLVTRCSMGCGGQAWPGKEHVLPDCQACQEHGRPPPSLLRSSKPLQHPPGSCPTQARFCYRGLENFWKTLPRLNLESILSSDSSLMCFKHVISPRSVRDWVPGWAQVCAGQQTCLLSQQKTPYPLQHTHTQGRGWAGSERWQLWAVPLGMGPLLQPAVCFRKAG